LKDIIPTPNGLEYIRKWEDIYTEAEGGGLKGGICPSTLKNFIIACVKKFKLLSAMNDAP
jgi:hypothetical protein